MSTHIERFEAAADLYYRRFHRLAPGKAEAPETGRSSSDEENHRQWTDWFASPTAYGDAIERIIALEAELSELRNFRSNSVCNDCGSYDVGVPK